MSASIIQTRRGKEKEQAVAEAEEGKEDKAGADENTTTAHSVQILVEEQDEQEEEAAGAVPVTMHVEAKQDSHVQIIASGSVREI